MFDALTNWLVAISLLFGVYIYVWSRGTRDGKFSRTIRILEHDLNYWRKRALRDEKILSKLIDKKRLALFAVLGLFLISIANPCPYSMPPAMGNEITDEMINRFGETLPDNTLHYPDYIPAADGDESSESITSFSETLADDVMFYPDAFLNDTVVLANAGTGSPDDEGTNYTLTHSMETGYFGAIDIEAPADVDMLLNFTLPSGLDIEAVDINLYVMTNVVGTLYAYDGSVWDSVGSFGTSTAWYNSTFYDADGISSNLELNLTIDTAGAGAIYLVYAEVQYHVMTLADSDHYAESFADVSDWAGTGSSTVTSDGDIMTHDATTAEYADSDGPSFASMEGLYVELRIKTNVSISVVFYGAHADGITGGWAFQQSLGTITTTWVTKKYYIPSMTGYDAGALESIRFSPASAAKVYVDYLRIGPADEMGWQHDGSTTTGTGSLSSCTVASDGDKLNVTGTAGGSGYFELVMDSTTTVARIEEDYYQFAELSISAVNDADADGLVGCPEIYGSDGTGYIVSGIWFTDAGIYRTNIIAGGSGDPYKIRFYVDGGDWYTIDYVKFYSIANFTVTQSGSCTTADVVYVDASDNLVFDRATTTWMVLELDRTVSITIATYNIWNITKSGSDGFGIRLRGSPSWGWGTVQYGETRGATADLIPSSDTSIMTIQIHSQSVVGVCIISAIKFIEDSTAPDILDKFVTPIIPDDDESVTLTVVTYDAVEVYEVTINAVVYPAGFSDVDYDLTEQTTNVLWSYEFSTLTAGYYLFQVTANDGANMYSEYIPVTVRVSTIEITTYTFFGASSDFSFMQFSGYISHDCTYNILEWSDSWAKNETHTGSVSEGMFNIAWDKIRVDDTEANFTIIFVSGSLSKTVPGYYGTAYKELRITEIDVGNLEESLAETNITINFYTNKDVDWFVYDRDDSDAVLASGSSSEGSDYLTWLKDTTPHAHYFAVKWTDGVSNLWFNSSYWTYKENIDSIDQPGKDWDAADTRRTIEFWTTLGAFAAIFGVAAIGISHYKLNKKIGNLPKYQTQ